MFRSESQAADRLMQTRDEEAQAQMDVTFYGPLRLTQAALPGLRKRKTGTIVNITSTAAINGLPSCGIYAASKFALEGEMTAFSSHLSSD